MSLNVFWFWVIAVLFVGYFFLEGFDYGVGMLYRFIAATDRERRVALNAIGPTWGANEVWLITAGGAIFAAFPEWYATLFSGFYLALVLMLLGLIARGVALEYRSAHDHPRWHAVWDTATMIGSFLPAFLWGVAMANLVRGVPIDQAMNYVGTLSTLLNPFALWSGLTMVTVFLTHGAYFLAMKTDGSVQKRSTAVARPLARIAFVVTALFLYWADRLPTFHPAPTAVVVGLGAWAAMVAAAIWSGRGARRGPFFLHGFAIMLITAGGFIALFPRLMISSLNPAWTLTIYNAASNPYTLQVMSWVALTLVPVVLAYQVWTYWLFRKRTSVQSSMEY